MTDAERELLLACAQQAIYHAQKSNGDDDARLRALVEQVRDEHDTDQHPACCQEPDEYGT